MFNIPNGTDGEPASEPAIWIVDAFGNKHYLRPGARSILKAFPDCPVTLSVRKPCWIAWEDMIVDVFIDT